MAKLRRRAYVGEAPLALMQVRHAGILRIRDKLVSPICEEIVFRAVICGLLRAGGVSTTATLFASPALFGLAHVHHFWNLIHVRITTRYAEKTVLRHDTGPFAMMSLLNYLHQLAYPHLPHIISFFPFADSFVLWQAQGVAKSAAFAGVFLQLCYTSLFGVISGTLSLDVLNMFLFAGYI